MPAPCSTFSTGSTRRRRDRDQAPHRRAAAPGRLRSSPRWREVEQDIRIDYASLGAAREKIATIEAEITSAERVADLYKQQFRGGRRTVFDLLDAEQLLFAARAKETANRIALRAAEYRVLQKLGGLFDLVSGGQPLPRSPSPHRAARTDIPLQRSGPAGGVWPQPHRWKSGGSSIQALNFTGARTGCPAVEVIWSRSVAPSRYPRQVQGEQGLARLTPEVEFPAGGEGAQVAVQKQALGAAKVVQLDADRQSQARHQVCPLQGRDRRRRRRAGVHRWLAGDHPGHGAGRVFRAQAHDPFTDEGSSPRSRRGGHGGRDQPAEPRDGAAPQQRRWRPRRPGRSEGRRGRCSPKDSAQAQAEAAAKQEKQHKSRRDRQGAHREDQRFAAGEPLQRRASSRPARRIRRPTMPWGRPGHRQARAQAEASNCSTPKASRAGPKAARP